MGNKKTATKDTVIKDGGVNTSDLMMDGGVTDSTLRGWEMRDDWNGENNFPRWKTFANEISYRPYTIKDVQSRIDDAEPENMYNNATGCGLPPLLPWGAAGKKKLAEYRACTQGAQSSSRNLDDALAEALRAKASAPQSSGLGTGAILMIVGSLAVIGVGAYFILRK